ncbi:hypothetical protein CY0110_02364 [Crocosphaera chwakensis CCY0110]|uniref:Uncharacterized protein n=1 Tax=Crocosphaera chwakensis CCY0110 TaxID=391612 RepID=A3IM76_9CHRO|nr:hypothetical protein CY0110_02364 [Crocosphaera chwakensis CCY0110]
MIKVDQAFLAVWFLAMIFILLLNYNNNLRKNFESFYLSYFFLDCSAKAILMKFTAKHTLVNVLCCVKTFLKVTEKNTLCM